MNKINKQIRLTDTKQTQLLEGFVGGWVEKVKELNKKQNKMKQLINTEDSMVITRGAWEEVEDGKGGISDEGRRLDFGS